MIKRKKNINKGYFNESNWSFASLNWDKYASPFRLSKNDCDNYLNLINKIDKNKKILVLGSTPEIREILFRNKYHSFLVDFSWEMIIRMLSSKHEIDESKETWIKMNWLNIDKLFSLSSFDLILGDLILRNIKSDLQSEFLKKISRLLKREGRFIGRFHFINQGLIKLDSDDIIKSVFKEYEHKKIKTELIEDLIVSRLFDKNTNFIIKTINKNIFLNDIKRYSKNAKNKKEKLILNNILKKWFGEKTWIQKTSKEVNQLLSKYFLIESTKIANDYQDSEFYPLYVLKRK